MNTIARPRPLVVIILDGWGISFVEKGNAIMAASTPTMDEIAHFYPTAAILAAGIEVGLPWGEVGNSETGHRNIGAGQVQYQALPQIDKAIEDRTFFDNPTLQQLVRHVQDNQSNLHIMGLVSPGGVHAHMNHLFALLELCAKAGLRENVYIHMFTDGRDTLPESALTYLTALEEVIGRYGVGKIASVTGRFHAMDRNENWERTEATYQMMIGGKRQTGAPTARQAIEQAYQQGLSDEVILPTPITRGGGPIAQIQDNDAAIFFNFRPDRARQLMYAFSQPDKVGFETKKFNNLFFVTMAKYDRDQAAPAAYEEKQGEYPLARIISEAGLTQMHIAETEKYAHVTYYLNVGHEKPFPGEKHVLIRSSGIKDFAKDPRMKAREITDRVLHEIEQGLYDIYFINYANPDMVGHTGNFKAGLEACSFVDECIGRLKEATSPIGGALLVLADHGNAEEMINPQTGEVETDHTSNPVPLYYVADSARRTTPKTEAELTGLLASPIGVLADVAPTVLEILNIEKLPDMTGISLLNSLQ